MASFRFYCACFPAFVKIDFYLTNFGILLPQPLNLKVAPESPCKIPPYALQ